MNGGSNLPFPPEKTTLKKPRLITTTECERYLNNTKNYRHLHKYPAASNNEIAHNVIKKSGNEKFIQKNIVEGPKINYPILKSPILYSS